MKLLHRFTIAFGLLLLIVTGATAYFIHDMLLDQLVEQQRRELIQKGTFWIQELKADGEFQPKDVEELRRLLVSNKKVEALLLARKNRVAYTTLPANTLGDWLAELQRKVKTRSTRSIWNVGNTQYIVVTLPIQGDEARRLVLATPVQGLKEIRVELTRQILVILIIGAVAAVILSFFITRSLVRPLGELGKELQKVQMRRFSDVQLIPAKGEIGEVARNVYYMAQELNHFHDVQKQFFQNASHELKTPLMSIQGYAEGIRDGVFTGEAAEQGLDVIVSETARLKEIVSEMILLAKLESEEDIFHPSDVSVTALAERAIERLNPLAVKQNVAITLVDEAGNAIVWADGDKLLQALLNVLSNALRYANRHIRLRVTSDARQVAIEVADDGPGIPETLLPNLFHRFVKGKDGETGLGLAISRAIVERSGGTIQAFNAASGGAVFRIELPQAKEPPKRAAR